MLVWFLLIILSMSYSFASEKQKVLNIPSDLVPAYILSPSPYPVLIAEKNTGYLHVFKGNDYQHSYPMSSGIIKGNKKEAGDKKTPQGVYLLERKLGVNTLKRVFKDKASIFGEGALTLNYPNPVDKKEKKTGANIWLHGTNDESRIANPQTSQGCLVLENYNFKELEREFHPKKVVVVITDTMEYIKKETQESYPQTYPLIRYRNHMLQIKGQGRYLGSIDEAGLE